MAEITAKFRERALFVSQYAADEEMKKTRYHDILRDYIGEFVSFSACKTLNDMVEKSRMREIDLELRTKRKLEQVQTGLGQTKRPNTSDTYSIGQQGQGRCAKCGMSHSGACRSVAS